MIKPTPGRVVWYYPSLGEPGPAVPGPLAATVAGVIDDETVNLTVHTFEGDVYARQKVALCQGDTRPERPYAEWMPYQLGQAAKAAPDTGLGQSIAAPTVKEALEKAAAASAKKAARKK